MEQKNGNHYTLPDTLDNILGHTLDALNEYRPQHLTFNLCDVLDHTYRLMLPLLVKADMQLAIKNQTSGNNRVAGDPGGLCQLLILLLHQFVASGSIEKISIELSYKNDMVLLELGGIGDRSYCLDLLKQPLIRRWFELLDVSADCSADECACLKLYVPMEAVKEEKTVPTLEAPQILIVEDNDINATVLTHFLEPYTDGIHRVINGEKAVDYVSGHRADLIMMDLNMPIMDGLEASKKIRQLNLTPSPVIIAVTADGTEATRQACIDAGMDAFLAKPYTTMELYQLIDRFLVDQGKTG